jgi:hypothetical protein
VAGVEATYSFAQDASARFRRYRKTSQSTSAARMISRTASVIPNTNAEVLNSSTVALLAVAKVPRLPRAAVATKLS